MRTHLTINEAAEITGWSPRMLRYVEQVGLISASRSTAGYRLYGPAQLQRLRTLRELLDRFSIGLTDLGFALRLKRDETLRGAVDEWLVAEPDRPEHVDPSDWLAWEQRKHQRLLEAADTGGIPHREQSTDDEPDHTFVKESV